MGTSTSSITIRKMGKELMDEGDFEGSTNVQFLRSLHGTFAVTVRQGPTKNGPFRDVSGRFVSDF
jgi:hypothetical protein